MSSSAKKLYEAGIFGTIEEAEEAERKVLKRYVGFSSLEEVEKAVAAHHNPFDETAEAIIQLIETGRKQDAKKRAKNRKFYDHHYKQRNK